MTNTTTQAHDPPAASDGEQDGNPLAIRTAEILLGEITYSVREATRKRARKFWPILIGEIKPAMEGVSSAVKLGADSSSDDLVAILPYLEKVIVEVPERIIDALCEYDVGLESARAAIEEGATDRQASFTRCLPSWRCPTLSG